MVKITDLSGIPDNTPAAVTLSQESFSRGVISIVDESKLPQNALKEADNMTLVENGSPKVRPGVDWFGSLISTATLDGGAVFEAADESVHLLAIAGGEVYRSLNDGDTWEKCALASSVSSVFTAGKKVGYLQANTFDYLYNGYDNIVRYDGTLTLAAYNAITTPGANVPTKTGLTGTAYTYYYRVSAVNDIGYTAATASASGLIQTGLERRNFDDTNFVTFTWTAVTGATRYDIYVGQEAGQEVYVGSVSGQATTTYIDKGIDVEQVSILAPDTNTTQGPRCSDMTLVGSRIYATGDRDFPYRIWISGSGRYIGYFSSAYDATYIDWQKGGQHRPIKIADYRDGKGTPLATVWCKSKDGLGSVLQGSLDTFTVGDITIPVPNFYRLPGSRGTNAPGSVVNVLNDYMYYNQQAFFNLGSRASFLNLLSTDEASGNIRDDVKRIRQSASNGIAAHFQDAKVYFSVPYDSDVNNATAVFDTERKAWLPNGFTIGFEKFLTYGGNDGKIRLLAWKPGDKRFSQISEEIRGDYGVAFKTSLITGLRPVNPKNRFDFIWCEEAEFEFAQPKGSIAVELSGITREDGYRTIDTKNISPSSQKVSWTIDKWTTHKWSAKGSIASTFSEPSMKRFFSVQEEINAYQYRITTESLTSDYILRTLQVTGTATDSGKPSEWELFD